MKKLKRQMKTMDGNSAAAHVSYAFSELATIYPITPSSNMADEVDRWSAAGRKNIFGNTLKVVELQSEGGAAGAMHGSLQAGAFTTTYTASQGLLLMLPNLYKIAGELLPAVFHVSARTIASHALSIFGDHSDIYAARPTGCAILGATNPQEIMDLSAVSHLATLSSRIPFINFFDGFRTSHELQKIESWDYDDLASMVDNEDIKAFRHRALNPNAPVQRGTAQNPDVFFQYREASNPHYDACPAIVEKYMKMVNKKIGTDYKLFNYYGAPDADKIIIAMGSVCDTIEETIDVMMKEGQKVGLLKVRLYRPFAIDKFIEEIPATVKNIAVLDRTKEPGAIGEPLYLDVVAALKGSKFDKAKIQSGRYGLSSKDTIPADVIAVYKNIDTQEKHRFTIGIVDDLTNLSLERGANVNTTPEGTTSCKFWGFGSDGTVGANKNSIKIIGDETDMYAQAYFAYDSKKSGGITISHLRFGKNKIKSCYEIFEADFVACHNQSYVDKYEMVEELIKGGTFLLNTQWTDMEELSKNLPNSMKKYIANNDIKFYIIDGVDLAEKIGLGGRINTILQAAFFNLSGIIPAADAEKYMKDAAKKSYQSKGESIVQMNYKAIEEGASGLIKIDIPADWKTAGENPVVNDIECGSEFLNHYINKIARPINAQQGGKLPVSTFKDLADGTAPLGTASFEKRGIATHCPDWATENCIQCNFCSYVCPHGVIRPFVMTEEEAKSAPEGMKIIDMQGMPGYKFAIAVSIMDCTGCGSCANVCPGRKGEKALIMTEFEQKKAEQPNFDYAFSLPEKPEVFEKFKENTVKGSQFKQPLLEFSGACAGCGETPYAKLATQLYGQRMYIANATGCSSIWGGSTPSVPYTTNQQNLGPAWANSLFEDNAEYGYGMFLAQDTIRSHMKTKVKAIFAESEGELKLAAEDYLATYDDGKANESSSLSLIKALEDSSSELAKEILIEKAYLNKKSVWIFGGDGWAYDIGFGGLDHVIASGANVNILVFDTEVYSNTGGQASKATQIGATAQFASAGKEVRKKDLAGIAISYGYVYVAQVAQGANYNQCIKAFSEAESYDGPSIIIAYSPCIAHGIRGGMGVSQTQEKRAVEAGYWHLLRFDPRLKEEGKNPFQLDSKEPSMDYEDFISSEVRYSSLLRSDKERAEKLFAEAALYAKEKYQSMLKVAKLHEIN